MEIASPKHDAGDMNRAMHCEEVVHPVIGALIEQSQNSGWTSDEILLAIEEVVKDFRMSQLSQS